MGKLSTPPFTARTLPDTIPILISPGATGTVTIGYTLKDDSEVTVDVTDLFDLNDSAKVVHKFTV